MAKARDMKLLIAGAVATLALAAVLPAEAQPDRRRGGPRGPQEPEITLFELPDFQGRRLPLYADVTNLADIGFNDRARSARISGSWRLCEDKNFRSRCEPFASDVRDFAVFGMDAKISSIQQIGGRVGRPGLETPYAGGERTASRDGVEGRSVVFFRRPTLDGLDVAGGGPEAANGFCRQAGLREAVYFDEGERGGRALDRSGRVVTGTPVLRDVVCRR